MWSAACGTSNKKWSSISYGGTYALGERGNHLDTPRQQRAARPTTTLHSGQLAHKTSASISGMIRIRFMQQPTAAGKSLNLALRMTLFPSQTLQPSRARSPSLRTYRVCSVSVLREPYIVSRWRRSSLRVRLRGQEPPLPCPHAPHRLPRKGSRKFAPRSAIATSLGEVFLERRDSEFQWNCAFYFAYSICSSLKIVPALTAVFSALPLSRLISAVTAAAHTQQQTPRHFHNYLLW